MEKCKFCGTLTSHRKIGINKIYWVCKICDLNRCKDCGCFLHYRDSVDDLCMECFNDRKVEFEKKKGGLLK